MDDESVLMMVTAGIHACLADAFLKSYFLLFRAVGECRFFDRKYLPEVREFTVALLDCESHEAMRALVDAHPCGAKCLISLMTALTISSHAFRAKKYRRKRFQPKAGKPFFSFALMALDELDRVEARHPGSTLPRV